MSARVTVFAAFWCYLLTHIMVLAQTIVKAHSTLLAVNPYYGATLFLLVNPFFMIAIDPDVNPCYGVSLFYGASPSDSVGSYPMQ